MVDEKDSDRELISVVVTVKNEASNMRDLLDSLVTQEGPLEILIIDAASTDGTQDIVHSYQKQYPFIILHQYAAQRGESRNKGIEIAKGSIVAFTDGDCIANPFWAQEIRASLKKADIFFGSQHTMTPAHCIHTFTIGWSWHVWIEILTQISYVERPYSIIFLIPGTKVLPPA